MTLLQKALAQYIEICSRSDMEKRNAWALAKENAEKFPELLGELPEMLTSEMLQRQANAALQVAQTAMGLRNE